MDAQTATGVPKPAAPSKNAPKAKAIGSDACQTVLQLSESAGSHGELIQEQDREDDPTDREESVGGTVAGREKRETHRHVKDHESDCERGSKAGEGGDMPFDAEASHGYKKHEQR
jgi:hypothetical protein